MRDSTKLSQRWWAVVVLVAAGGLGVAVLVDRAQSGSAGAPGDELTSAPVASQSSQETGTLSGGGAAARFESQPRQLTDTECVEANRRMESMVQIQAKSLQKYDPGNVTLKARFDAAVAESRTWFAAGCPKHPVLGYYDALDGSGDMMGKLIDFP